MSRISSSAATWSCLVILLSVHLAMNHAAVRAVSMRSLNRQRSNIALSRFLDDGRIMTPEEVSRQERIFERNNILRWNCSPALAKASIGMPLQKLISVLAPMHAATGSTRDPESQLQHLIETFSNEKYLLWFDARAVVVLIVIKEGADPQSLLKAWAQALLIAHRYHEDNATCALAEGVFQLVRSSLKDVSSKFEDCLAGLSAAGWDVDIGSLEISSTTRLRLDTNNCIGQSS